MNAASLFGTLAWEDPVVTTQSEGFLLPAGTATLLLADLEGSTRMWEAGSDAATAVVARLDDVVPETIGRHNGVRPLEQGEGDSFVAAFARPSDAVACALDLQRELLPHGVRLRIAVHTGEVQLRGERNYVGPTINRCARVRDAGHGGQILVTSAMAELVGDRLPAGASLRDLGLHRFRDLSRAERVHQLCHPDLPDEFPALRSLDARPHNLPVQLTRFVGRGAEIAELRRRLDETRLLTIVGTGGAGKTRLALQAAAEAIDDLPGGAWFVDLAEITDAEHIADAVRLAIGFREDPARDPADVIASGLGDRAALVILDNCEQVAAGCARAAETLLGVCPGLTVLATSREPLGSAAESLWQIPALSLPSDDAPPRIAALGASEAVDLFVDRARKARAHFALTEDNVVAIAAICRRLDGIPLAIELAAARVRALPVDRIASGLDDRFRVLGVGPRTAVPRHQTLRASIDWSYSLLSVQERTVFRRLSVFAGGFELDAAEHVCALDDIDSYAVLDLVSALVDRSLIEADERGRYRMLETVRQYARERLDEASERDGVEARHRDWFVGWSVHALEELRGADERGWTARLVAETENLRAARRSAATCNEAQHLSALSLAMYQIRWVHGGVPESVTWITECLARADELPETACIDLLLAAAGAEYRCDDHEGALAHAIDARRRAEAIGDAPRTSDAIGYIGWCQAHLRNVDEGIAALEEAIEVAAGDSWWTAWGLVHLAQFHGSAGRLEIAMRYVEDATRMAKDHGHARTLRAALATSAMLKHRLGDLHGARDGFAAAVDEARDVADRAAVGEASHNLGQVLLYLGDVDGARRAFEEAHETARRIGEPFPEAGYYDGLLELAADRPREAAAAFLSTRIAGRFSENRSFSAMLLAQLVRALVQTGDVEDARAHAAEAWERAQGLGIVHALASAYGARGFIHEADGEIDAAEEAFHEAVRIHADGGGRHYVAQNLIFIASIAAQAESFEESARLLGAIERMCTETGLVPFPDLLRRRATAEASCKAALGDERYAALFGEGRALDWREAVAYAQRGRGERGRPSHGWASLTPMETSVVELVAQGMTNPQIAAKLFISPRTVQSHLRNVFPKVGVATRAELAAEAARRGAVSSS